VLGSKIRQGEWHVLIQWAGMSTSEATWEPVDQFRTSFPTFQLEDELFVEGGGLKATARTRRDRGRASPRVGSNKSVVF
jgi:hypothetical protein